LDAVPHTKHKGKSILDWRIPNFCYRTSSMPREEKYKMPKNKVFEKVKSRRIAATRQFTKVLEYEFKSVEGFLQAAAEARK